MTGERGPKRRVTTSKSWVGRGPLVPWMTNYAAWLAQQPEAVLSRKNAPPGYRRGHPSTSERTANASKIARRKISKNLITMLEQREDFANFFEKLRADAQFLAKELLRQDIARNVEVRRAGLEEAVMMHDHREIRQYTQWTTDLGFPKKEIQESAQPRVVINIGSGEAKALLGKMLEEPEEVQDVEFEVLETKQLGPGADID